MGALLLGSPLGSTLGFQPLPGGLFNVLVGMIVCYLALTEAGKRMFYGAPPRPPTAAAVRPAATTAAARPTSALATTLRTDERRMTFNRTWPGPSTRRDSRRWLG
ncbi:hypothetical protein [Dactylosporangium salmoneum]|uniref:Uncharacterized protein n=1 Tax=Dactylosporangium salmoneum TaxID=53361 RepID=A0ABP5SVH9_9ACTN